APRTRASASTSRRPHRARRWRDRDSAWPAASRWRRSGWADWTWRGSRVSVATVIAGLAMRSQDSEREGHSRCGSLTGCMVPRFAAAIARNASGTGGRRSASRLVLACRTTMAIVEAASFCLERQIALDGHKAVERLRGAGEQLPILNPGPSHLAHCPDIVDVR